MTQRIRTALLVGVVSLIIWLYAEAESLSRVEREATVTVSAAGEDLAVRTPDPEWRGAVRLKLEGSTASITRAPRSFTLSPGDPGVPAQEGERRIDLRAALSANADMARTGVAILSVEPPTLLVRVLPLARLPEVDIRAEVSGVALAGEPTIEPAKVSVVGPRETLERMSAMLGGAVVTARVSPQAAAGAEEGKPTRLTAKLGLPVGIDETDVVITPREATVIITKGAAATWQAPSPVLRVVLPAAEASRWRVEPAEDQRFVRGVVVSGPPAQVDRFRSGELTLVAVISLGVGELQAGERTADVAFLAERDGALGPLPAGVVISAPERVVRLTIAPAQAPAGETPR